MERFNQFKLRRVCFKMKKSRQVNKSKKGVTLVELVVAITLVSIVFSATITAIVHSYTTVQTNRSNEEASLISRSLTDTIVSTIANAADVSEVEELANGVPGTHVGFAAKAGAYYIDRLGGSSEEFPNPSASNPDKQFIIEAVNDLETSKSGTAGKKISGYKVSVAVLSSQGYIITSAFTTLK